AAGCPIGRPPNRDSPRVWVGPRRVVLARIYAAHEAIRGVAGTGQPVEFVDEFLDPFPELVDLLARQSSVTDERRQLVCLVGRFRFLGRYLEVVEVER